MTYQEPILTRLRVVPHLSSGIVEQAKITPREKARSGGDREKLFSLPTACRLFSREVIFTRARVSLTLLSLRTNGGLLVV